ncbi:putative gamma-glutamyltransferase [Encephalitozoon hellem ATCC 50504]|uniref:Glutathione hydrolase n=1 Tax=Encephalitozoon hellem TaxID=27973 RepID=A0A9Q9FBI3_ENCHE|nr:putative gamma-glutamyltransferase [Encephalitozoon hellem ATCC 50504]AFM98344.1 putative gamma-glutamyltransferase [Encephalitozoon hellem ATCC 50504]UTX43225.1 glutaryl-7-aminocephalosporanic-acid acylase [Encephalitozoon hellem]WEL38682.1 gamma-glutamyltransferase [Encephalitozoon hellem]|eukprot:XP_003887325.1 putative gamma-glutamyltransferase [Encephalitozoon hellem ATCC 50504]
MEGRLKLLISLFGLLLVLVAEGSFAHNPNLEAFKVYSNGACTTEVPLCSRLGVKKLMEGGNAMDAAIASTICIGIINSFSSGIGGGGFMLIKGPGAKGVLDMIDFRETAPRSLSASDLNVMAGESPKGLKVGIPGEILGLYEAHKKYGKLPWRELFQENIVIARGFSASSQLVKKINKLRDYILSDPGLREIYTRNGVLLREGDTVVRENYAKTLEIIMKRPESFYTGSLADLIVKAVRKNGGLIDKRDLEEYKVMHRNVVEGKYRDYKVYTTNLPTSGPLVLRALNILERYDLKKLKADSLRNRSFNHIHLLIEVLKFAMARRGELGDPAFLPRWEEIVREIVSKKSAEEAYRKINLGKVLDIKEYGMKTAGIEDHGTTHINVIDKDNMAVLITSSVNLEFGAKFMDPETGIVFNDTIDDFYIPYTKYTHEKHPNGVEGGKRSFSSISPILLLKEDEILALGAAGGIRIPTSVISTIFHLETGESLRDAIMETRIHNHLSPNTTFVEYNILKDLERYLTGAGHKIEKSLQNTIFTSVQGILLKKVGGNRIIHAVSDPRKGGEAFGY